MPDKTSLPSSEITEAKYKPRRSISSVWLLPLIALLIGIWLIYHTIATAGITVTLNMSSADGIVAGKTPVIYKGLPAGKVEEVKINKGLNGVIVKIELQRDLEPLIKDKTEFWVVSPQISAANISGLETLFSGNYITFRPGTGEQRNHFTVLKNPPPLSTTAEGLNLTLTADTLGSVERGSPIYYKQIKVGSVQDYRFSKNHQKILIDIHINPEYSHLVSKSSRFWNASGVNISANLAGLNIHTESITSLLAGGIAFYTPKTLKPTPAENAESFKLYKNYTDAQAGIMITVKFPNGQGLTPDHTKVIYQGIDIGVVKRVDINPDLHSVDAHIMLNPRAEPGLIEGTKFWLVKPHISLEGVSGLDTLVSGNYINIQLGSHANAKPKFNFDALPGPPPLDYSVPGLHLVLSTPYLGSLTPGNPIMFRQVKVGTVEGYRFSKNHRKILVDIHISPEYSDLINSSTRFWSASGITLSGGLKGFKIETESLSTILAGGIAFTTPAANAKKVKNGHSFNLYPDQTSATENGIPIKIHFSQGSGLERGAAIRYRGIQVGEVTSVKLDRALEGVTVHALLDSSAARLAKDQSQFWIVKPQLGLARTANLDTLIRGVYIGVRPAGDISARTFNGLDQPPSDQRGDTGLSITLLSPRLGSLKPGVGVYYREVKVGEVTGYKLADNATQVEIRVNIFPNYRNLVHRNSRFWNASGIGVNIGLLSGAKIKTESLESLLEGGVAFATPNQGDMGPAATGGERFKLYQEAHSNWLEWAPNIKLNTDIAEP